MSRALYIDRLGSDLWTVEDPVTRQKYKFCKSQQEAIDYLRHFPWDNIPPFIEESMQVEQGVAIKTEKENNITPRVRKQKRKSGKRRNGV